MNTRRKILLDRTVGIPFAWATNVAARVLGRLLRRDHATHPESVREIVVQKLLGMGSIIQATPLLAALRERFSGARITLLTVRANAGLVERLPLVDRWLYVDDRDLQTLATSTIQVIRAMLQQRVDLFFDLELYSAAASVLSALSCARNRYGFYRHSARFKQNLYTHLVKFATNIPISRLYLQLGLAAGTREVPIDRLGPLRLEPDDHRRLADKLGALGVRLGGDYIVVNPNASDLLVERRWPAASFATVLDRLVQEGRTCVLVGSGDEAGYVRDLVGRLSAEARRHVVDTAGRLELGELLALIARARCVVTNDTGPMHFAFALQRPTVCLFGPVDPLHYSFEAAEVETLYHPVFCSPCVHENQSPPCGGDNVCMQLIGPDAVLDAVHRLLGESGASRPAPAPRRYVDLGGRALGVIARVSLPASRPTADTASEVPSAVDGEPEPRRRRLT